MANIRDTSDSNLIIGTNRRDFISALEGDDLIGGLGGNDTIGANDGDDFVFSGEGNDSVRGGRGNDFLVGQEDNDYIIGGRGNDIVVGSQVIEFSGSNIGQNEIDSLTGGANYDTFVLGGGTFLFALGNLGITLNEVYYDDEDPNTLGRDDYALITDFQKNQDTIQLFGDPNDYILDPTFRIDDRHGTAIFLKDDVNELIGLAEGVFDLDLNSDYFSFV